jgi:hypothetical protein
MAASVPRSRLARNSTVEQAIGRKAIRLTPKKKWNLTMVMNHINAMDKSL